MTNITELDLTAFKKALNAVGKKKAKKGVAPKKVGSPKYQRKGEKRIPGESQPFREMKSGPPIKVPTHYFTDTKTVRNGKLIQPVKVHYLPEELDQATYSLLDFIGTYPQRACHLNITI